METMNPAPVIDMPERRRRMQRAVAERRRLDRAPFPHTSEGRTRSRAGGRVWVNGVELGGTDRRHASLAAGHD